MKNKIIRHNKTEKLLFGAAAVTSLGWLSVVNNVRLVKADNVSSNYLLTQTNEKNQINQNGTKTRAENSLSDNGDLQNSSIENGSSPSFNAIKPAGSMLSEQSKSIASINPVKSDDDQLHAMWNGLDVVYDRTTYTLTIPGSSEIITSPGKIFSIYFSDSGEDSNGETVSLNDLKKIRITGQLKFAGNLDYLFSDLQSLTEIEGLSNFDTSDIDSMGHMFDGCENLTKIDLSGFDTENVTNMEYMFSNCSSLEELDLSKLDLSVLRNTDQMLENMTELSLLVLGKNASGFGTSEGYNLIIHSGLDTPGTWSKVGQGTDDNPEELEKWSSYELRELFSGETDADRYVRLASLTVHYVDDKGKKVADDSVINGRRLSQKVIEPKTVAGYTLKTVPANLTYKFIDGQQEITYVYQLASSESVSPSKISNVIVKYLDENGNSIASDETLTGKVGDGYVSEDKAIAGYTLKLRPSNAVGSFTDNEQTVIYIYRLIKQKNSQILNVQVDKNNPQSSELITGRHPERVSQHRSGRQTNNPIIDTSQDQKLPQTSFDKNSLLITTLLGAFALLASLLGINIKHRK